MTILQSNTIRGIAIIIVGMLIADLTTYGNVGEVDWRPTIIRYAVALLAAVGRVLGVGTTADADRLL